MADAAVSTEENSEGLQFRLSEGKAPLDSGADTVPRGQATPLSDADAERVLARVKPLVERTSDTVAFALRESSLPPPRAGLTVAAPFPTPATEEGSPVAAAPEPLMVVRVTPEGDVALADRVSVTFSQPMVPVTSQEEAAKNVPVILMPGVPGTWRWLGTQTLIFDAGSGNRLPMATTYRVTVPAGTQSAIGGVLAEEHTVVFQTPPVQLLAYRPAKPEEPQSREPLIRVFFDQRVDPDAVLSALTLRAAGIDYPLRLATDAEMEADPAQDYWKNSVSGIPSDRTVAVKPRHPLPWATGVTVTVGAKTPSLEGPRTMGTPQSFAFETASPLRIVDPPNGVEPHGNHCRVLFNNPLAVKSFDPSRVQVSPEIPGGGMVSIGGSALYAGNLEEAARPASYRVTIPTSLEDIFGQTLGTEQTRVFELGPAEPEVTGPDRDFFVCDPQAKPCVLFESINTSALHVKLFAVTAADWPAYLLYQNGGTYRKTPPGRLVWDTHVPLETPPGQWGQTQVDVEAALTNGQGNVIVQWESLARRAKEKPDHGACWMQATSLGLMSQVDDTDLYAWVTDLATGAPIRDARVELLGAQKANAIRAITTLQTVQTGSDGLAQLGLGASGAFVAAHWGEETAFLPAKQWHSSYSAWARQEPFEAERWFIFDDRQLYRPGENVNIKGWVRVRTAGKHGDLTLPTKLTHVRWKLQDSQGVEVRKGVARVNAWAGFTIAVELPETMNLGQATLTVKEQEHHFTVSEFRRPEFMVTAKNESSGPHIVGDSTGADVSVTAKYYAGGTLSDTDVTWNVSVTPSSYTPSGHRGYTFGAWTPWWQRGMGWDRERYSSPAKFTGRTDSDGMHHLHFDLYAISPVGNGGIRPYVVTAKAVIQDVNRQTLQAETSLIVHPGERYVGVKGRNLFVAKGNPLIFDALVCDIDGAIEAGQAIQFRAARETWNHTERGWQQGESDRQEWTALSGEDAVPTAFTPTEAGLWRVQATVQDSQGRANTTVLTFWVSGGRSAWGRSRNSRSESVTLIPDRETYAPGDTAEILVQSPFPDAYGLATILHEGVVKTLSFDLQGDSYTLQIPIAESWLPGIGVQVELVGAATRTSEDGELLPDVPLRPAYASGHLDLSIPPTTRRLTVAPVPEQAALEPGGATMVAVSVRDLAGLPVVNAEVALVVVDESVIALAGGHFADPLQAFYPERLTSISTNHLRQFIQLEPIESRVFAHALPSVAMMAMRGRGGIVAAEPAAAFGLAEGGDGGGYGSPIRLRENFDALATFAPSVATNDDGMAYVPVTLPDNLTRYRIVAVAVAGARQIGYGDASLTARLPLMARPSAPRFLNFGDRFELPIVVQNQTDDPMTVDVAVRATNMAFPEAHGCRVAVNANDRVEVRIPAEAVLPGTAHFQIAATSDNMADAAEVSLPVWTPATTEAFATYGAIDDGPIVQPVQTPDGVEPAFGGLEVTLSSTALQELTDAFGYIARYPFHCAEQVSSRILAVVALKDVLAAFETDDLPTQEEIRATLQSDIARLVKMQRKSGGFGFWADSGREYPYLSVHAAHAIAVTLPFGATMEVNLRSRHYLRHIASKFDDIYYTLEAQRLIRAYALYVRHKMHDTDTAAAKTLLAEDTLDALGPETLAFLMNVLAGDSAVKPVRAWLNNHVTETAGAAHFAFSYRDSDYLVLHSNRRADALVLDALIADHPKSDLIPKLVRGLLDGRRQGYWSNTQENAFALLALSRYFHACENTKPNFAAHLWLGDRLAGDSQFRKRTTDRIATNIPMSYLAQTPGTQNLTLDKQGVGRLYYRVGLRYAPKDLNLKPADHGFAVKRTYEAIDAPTDVRHNPDGSWTIRAGAKVRVRLSMVATTRRYHVALTDPLPAGFETLNANLKGTESVADDTATESRTRYRWGGHWWEHANLRDERVEAFTSLLWEGAYEYIYVCRATTPGQFVVPPAKAEEMYAPETFGRSGTDRVRVE